MPRYAQLAFLNMSDGKVLEMFVFNCRLSHTSLFYTNRRIVAGMKTRTHARTHAHSGTPLACDAAGAYGKNHASRVWAYNNLRPKFDQ